MTAPSHRRSPTVSLVSLGCPRTLVDSEMYLGRLKQAGFAVVDDVEGSDVAVINTCSFIQESIQESIDTVLSAVELKRRGKVKAVIVAGCLVQRFKDDVIKGLPEIDGFVGIDGFGDIDTVVQRALAGEPTTRLRRRPRPVPQDHIARVALTASHYAYLKISEGCLKGCSFCVIPRIKGPLSSRPLEEVLEEARRLIDERGVRELIVVGQDTSDYGVDRYGQPRIAELLRRLGSLSGVTWIRLLYCHPRGVSRDLIDALRETPTVCPYLDMAIEHADDEVLARMNRGITQAQLTETIGRLRAAIPSLALRTSVVVGFPGETEAAFDNLLGFLQRVRFERLGAFRYSQEEGSAAFRYADQIPEAIKAARYDRLMQVQQELSAETNRRWLGQACDVLIDEADPSDPTVFFGRTYADCPEVDGVVYVHSVAPLVPGQFVRATITDTYEYDLVATAHSNAA